MTRSACRRCKGSARARSTCPPCAAPQLAPRASPGRAWRLRAAQHSQGSAGPPGALPRPRLLEPAATEAARYPPPAWTVHYSRAARLLTYAPAHSPACSPAQASEEGAAPRDLRRREAAQDARAPRARANPSLNPEPHPSPNPNKARHYRELALSRTLPLAVAVAVALALARCATTEG